MRTLYVSLTLLLLTGPGGLSGCGGGSSPSKKKKRLTKKTYGARIKQCKKQLRAACLSEMGRYMKEKAETKKLAAQVDTLLKGKKTRPMFDKVTGQLVAIYGKLIDNIASEEAFQKAVRDGARKEVAPCFAKKGCDELARCIATAVTVPLLAVNGSDKALRKLVSRPSLQDRLMATSVLKTAVAIARPAMTDEHKKLSRGAALLAFWAAKIGLKLPAIRDLPGSDYKSIMKDSDEERGRHLCTKGRIIQIHAEKTQVGKIYNGGMFMGWGYSKVARFIAVGSTRGVNQGSRARFCGVVIGRYSYPNAAGGTTHAVQLVGLFDLAENR